MPTRASRLDANQAEIKLALEASGWAVKPMNILRGEWLDLSIAKQGVTIAVECKMTGKKLTEAENKFFQEWPGLKILAFSGQDAVDKAASMLRHWSK